MKWLHISDLHYDPKVSNFDTRQLLSKLEEYIEDHGITVDEIFYTGDFRFAKTQAATAENARLSANKLKVLASKAGVASSSIHIVPGNHDLERGDISLLDQAYGLYSYGEFSGFVDHMGRRLCCADYLWNRFQFFLLVAAELDNQIWLSTPPDGRTQIGRAHV